MKDFAFRSPMSESSVRRLVRRAAPAALALAAAVLWPLLAGRTARATGEPSGYAVRVLDKLDAALKEARPEQALDVIVTFNRPLEQLDTTLLPWHREPVLLRRAFTGERAVACRLSAAQLDAMARVGVVSQLEADVEVHAMRDAAERAVGVTDARANFGLSGDGDGDPERYSAADQTIAILDTGLDAAHADFAGGKVIAWRDFVNGQPDPYDDNGHGTHLASIAAGRSSSGPVGVAPGAALVGLKVLRSSGAGRLSDIAAALQYCIDERKRLGIRVANVSLGTEVSSDGSDLGSRMVNRAVAAGIVVVVAAGNAGPETRTIGAPGAASGAITVGCMADPLRGGFALSAFSGRGPTADGRVKPDLCAPGEGILAARANSGTGYRRHSGTSMAAPFVAGVVALMREADPTLTASRIKRILKETTIDFGAPGPDSDYGAGRLDAYAAIAAAGDASGAGPAAPAHWAAQGTLADQAVWERAVRVTTTAAPIAATLLISGWNGSEGPDFDLRLLDPSGQVIAESATNSRSEGIRILPRRTGAYTLQVVSRTGGGRFVVDVSGGE
jgi:serine protease AprX